MRLFALPLCLAVPLCSALVIPDQEVFESYAQIDYVYEEPETFEQAVDHVYRKTKDGDIEPWRAMVATIAQSSHETFTEIDLNWPGVEPSSEKSVKVLRGDDEEEEDDPDHDDDGDDSGDDSDSDDEGDDEGDDHEESQENHTIWQLISQNENTARLAELLSNEGDLIDLLNDTEANHTLFAPTNNGLERFLDDQPSHRALRQIEHYHIVPGSFSIGKLRRHQTIPTALKVPSLGKHVPQRIVVNLRQDHIVVNELSRLIGEDIIANNGIIHQISHPLPPHPNTSTILHLLPAHFSTFAHGLQVTNLAPYFWKHHRIGGTTFAPTDTAFQHLGPGVNAFLFSPQGRECLRALLEYHLVLDRTPYSDAFYDVHGRVDEFGSRGEDHFDVHVELPTLLRKKKIGVDVARMGAEVALRVNGFYQVATLDLVAADGVVHVLDEVLMPPRRIGKKVMGERLTVEVLKERLGGCGEA